MDASMERETPAPDAYMWHMTPNHIRAIALTLARHRDTGGIYSAQHFAEDLARSARDVENAADRADAAWREGGYREDAMPATDWDVMILVRRLADVMEQVAADLADGRADA